MRLTRSFILFLLFLGLAAGGQTTDIPGFPVPIGWVNDFDHIYTPQQAQSLDSLAGSCNRRTSVQIAIVTLDTLCSSRDSFSAYTLKLANVWGVGQKEKNNGLLIGISKGYRLIRIEVGYGLEALLSNDTAKAIIDRDITPAFKNGNYYEGTRAGLLRVIRQLDSGMK